MVMGTFDYLMIIMKALLMLMSSPPTASSFLIVALGLGRPSWKDSSLFHPTGHLKITTYKGLMSAKEAQLRQKRTLEGTLLGNVQTTIAKGIFLILKNVQLR